LLTDKVRPAIPPTGTLVSVVWQATAPDGYDFHVPGSTEPQTVEGRVVDVTDNHLHIRPPRKQYTVGVRLDWIVDLEDITPACSFEPCPRDAQTKGLCYTHWTQQHRGRPLTMPQVPAVDLIHDLLETRGGWWTADEIITELDIPADTVRTALRRNRDRFTSRPDPLQANANEARRSRFQWRATVALWEADRG
jgi:hypothetical protein